MDKCPYDRLPPLGVKRKRSYNQDISVDGQLLNNSSNPRVIRWEQSQNIFNFSNSDVNELTSMENAGRSLCINERNNVSKSFPDRESLQSGHSVSMLLNSKVFSHTQQNIMSHKASYGNFHEAFVSQASPVQPMSRAEMPFGVSSGHGDLHCLVRANNPGYCLATPRYIHDNCYAQVSKAESPSSFQLQVPVPSEASYFFVPHRSMNMASRENQMQSFGGIPLTLQSSAVKANSNADCHHYDEKSLKVGVTSPISTLSHPISGDFYCNAHGVEENTICKQPGILDSVPFDDWSLGAVVFSELSKFEHPKPAPMNYERPDSTQNTARTIAVINDESRNIGNIVTSLNPNESYLLDRKENESCDTEDCKMDINGMSKSENFDVRPNEHEGPQIGQEVENIKFMSEKLTRKDTNLISLQPTINSSSGLNLMEIEASVSLVDSFTVEQIKVHLQSLNESNNMRIGEESRENTAAHAFGENTCQLCVQDSLKLAPPPMYCTSCGAVIKFNSNYYWAPDGTGARYFFCTSCFRRSCRNMSILGLSIPKKDLQKGKNIEVEEEPWVYCDKCERWQHQICALYNSKRDLEGKVKYICPRCRSTEIEAAEHVSIPPAIGAKDLPRTMLSDHIELLLFRSLEQERKQRAELLGKPPEEVPGVSDLVVRVVLSTKKTVKVSSEFSSILHGEKYPTEFPYKSKAILLFQKVEGVDVCLFAMYVQEFGSECEPPNKRCTYISYLDSVKYFRPEIQTSDGVALRTFVYHEILIGYLDYCKLRGFSTCYIWSCPPVKGDDYILYCHPETQKIPKNDKLTQWYKLFLRKAKEENAVVEYSNFHDCFFGPNVNCDLKITATRLPYFDGDYWSSAVADILCTIDKEEQVKSENKSKKSKTQGIELSSLSIDAAKDAQMMQKLARNMLKFKEDFIVINLQYVCINCQQTLLSGTRWSCSQCNKLHLCNRCCELKQSSGGLPVLEKHARECGDTPLCQIAVNGLPDSTDDGDVFLDNESFENRLSFLSFCQKNNYQFNTLRHAKYSSMMILHHLQNSTTLTLGFICSICQQNTLVEWQCKVCPKFFVCTRCYQKEGDNCHIHNMIQLIKKAYTYSRTKSKEIHKRQTLENGTLELFKHASQCKPSRSNPCSYPKCLAVKSIFLHYQECQHRATGNCRKCHEFKSMLHLHIQYCKDMKCDFPHCVQIRIYKQRKLQQNSRFCNQQLHQDGHHDKFEKVSTCNIGKL